MPLSASTIIFTNNFPDVFVKNAGPLVGSFAVTAGCVDSYPGGSFGLPAGGAVDLDGSCLTLGSIKSSSTIPFDPGFSYTLSFNYSSNNDFSPALNTAQITLGTLVNQTLTGVQNTALLFSRSFTVNAPTSLNLIFQELGTADNRGVLINDITVTNNDITVTENLVTAVPEPASSGLVIGGLLVSCSLWIRRRTRRAETPSGLPASIGRAA